MFTQGGTENAQALAEPDSNVLLSADTGDLVREVPVRGTAWVRFDGDSLWSVSDDGVLTRIDPVTGETIATIGLGVEPGGLAVGEGSVWVTGRHSPTLFRIDPSVNERLKPFQLPMDGVVSDGTGEVAVGDGSVWVGHGTENPGAWVERLDDENRTCPEALLNPRRGRRPPRVRGRRPLGREHAVGRAAEVRSADEQGLSSSENSSPISAASRSAAASSGPGATPKASSGRSRPTGRVLPTIQLSAPIKRLTYANGALWAALGEAGTVVRIDPTTGETRPYEIGHSVTGVDVHDGLVAAAVRPGPDDVQQTIESAIGDLGGDVAWVGRKAGTLFDSGAPIEPAWTGPIWDVPQLQFHYATCARLLNYRDAEGDAGRQLVPEVAEDLPKVSDGGRTYTFTDPRGVRLLAALERGRDR